MRIITRDGSPPRAQLLHEYLSTYNYSENREEAAAEQLLLDIQESRGYEDGDKM